MTLIVGTDSYATLAEAYEYHMNHGNVIWTAYRKTITSIATHTDGILITTSAAHGYTANALVALYGTTNYNNVGSVVTVVDTTSFTLDLTYVADESSGYAVSNLLEVSLRKATEWIDNHPDHKGNWKGSLYLSTQSLSFPRSGLYDEEDRSLDDSTIPDMVKYACCEMAYKAISETIFPDIGQNTRGLKRSKIDVIEKEWFAPSTSNARKKYDYVDNLLSGLLKGSANMVSLTRTY